MTQLAVKVEGVITAVDQHTPWRSVESIKIIVTSNLVTPSKSVQLELGNNRKAFSDCNQYLEQIATPHNDFFTAQFLLPFPVPGMHQVVVDTRFVDKESRIWRTGQKVSLTIKAFDDAQNRTGGRTGTAPMR